MKPKPTASLTILALFALFFGQGFHSTSQPGSSLADPIVAGTIAAHATYSHTHAGFPDGPMNYIIYYRFVVTASAHIEISTAVDVPLATLQLMDASGQVLASKSVTPLLIMGPTPGETAMGISLGSALPAGTYIVKLTKAGAASQTMRITHQATEVDDSFYHRMDTIFGLLEHHRIPHSLLRDASLERTNLDNYAGTLLADSNRVDNAELMAIQQTLYTMRIGSTSPDMASAGEVALRQEDAEQEGRIVLSGLFYRYAQLKENALQNNLIQLAGDRLQDRYASGVWQNPYETTQAAAFAPTQYRYRGLGQQLLLPADLWMTNSPATVAGIEVDAGDGLGYRGITPGTPLTVNYPDTGFKTVKYRLTLDDSSLLQAHSTLYIASAFAEQYPTRSEVLSITSTETLNGIAAQGYVSILYANPDKQLRKPLIVAEGFDPGHILNPKDPFGENSIDNFVGQIRNLQIDNELRDVLFSAPQYDIVYIDYKHGTDDIRRNALLVKEVIRLVNTRKALAGSTKENVVWGESMGGLVARWALKSMENDSENHQTGLFISYDSPHLGANVPLGYQHMANHVRKLYIRSNVGLGYELVALAGGWRSYDAILGLANTPAARQMLINYVAPNGSIDNSEHNQWQTSLRNLGYPSGFTGQPLKRVAVSNGNVCGNLQDATPGTTLLSYEGRGNTRFLGDIIGSPLLPLPMPSPGGVPLFFSGVIPGKNDVEFDIQVNAIANGGGNQVYYNKISYTKHILWLLPITLTLTEDSRNAPSGFLPYDSYGGGYYQTPIDPSDPPQANWLYKYDVNMTIQPRFNFVPTVSALDIGSGYATLTDADYRAVYAGNDPPAAPKSSPFANFITASTSSGNEKHIAIAEHTGTWLATELSGNNGVVDNCLFVCSGGDVSISGPSTLCTSETYTVTNLPTGATVTGWSASPSGAVTFSGTGNSRTVSRSGSYNGEVTITASISTACGNLNVARKLFVGFPTIECLAYSNAIEPIDGDFPCPWEVGAVTYLCSTHPDNKLQIKTASPHSRYEVQIRSYPSLTVLYTQTVTSKHVTLNYTPWVPGLYNIRVRAIHNSCGTGPWYEEDIEYMDCYSPLSGEETWKIYPNPASETLTVSIGNEPERETMGSKASLPSFSAVLYDGQGRQLRQGESKDGSVQFDTGRLPNGPYFLHIHHDGQVEKRQVVIRH